MQTPNANGTIPATAGHSPNMCQTKQELDPTKDTQQRGQPFTFQRLPRNADYFEIYRHVSETVPIREVGSVNHRTMRNHRGHSVHFSMGVYENEPSPKTSHCYSPYGRMRPYFIPHRTRTKSESSDPSNLAQGQEDNVHPGSSATHATTSSTTHTPFGISTILMETCEPAMMDVSIAPGASTVRFKTPVVVLKKSRSLENVRVDNSLDGSQVSHEMEFVSSRIQKLKVQE